MRNYPSLLALAVAVSFSNLSYAGSDSGVYVGASVGTADVDYSDSAASAKFDDSDTGYKFFAGYNFGLVPFLNLAVEGGYMDLGSVEGEIANTTGNKIEANGWAAYGVGGFDMGPIGVFAKVGYFAWDSDFKTSLGNDSDSGTDPAFGLGAKFQLGSFAVRAEYEVFDLDKADIDYISVGAAYTF
ncbi:MAG: cell envelope biogenesis protein OmpA [Pseudomonadales bacterium]|nr:cell envelope biogenesis protein OmpA [Pseudomonadales bacterium]RLU04185.1 MAG: porin family protein [Ketobacter sp.]